MTNVERLLKFVVKAYVYAAFRSKKRYLDCNFDDFKGNASSIWQTDGKKTTNRAASRIDWSIVTSIASFKC